MKHLVWTAPAVMLVVGLWSPGAGAGTDTGPKLALHRTVPTTKAATICSTYNPNVLNGGIPCSQYSTQGGVLGGANQLVYLVVAQADTPSFNGGLGGLDFGIEYLGTSGMGVDVIGDWVLCADQDFPSDVPLWPASGSGNVVTWEPSLNCQATRLGGEGIHAVAGAFTVYVYSSDIFRVTPNRTKLTPDALFVADCAAAQAELDTTGVESGAGPISWVGFGNCMGCNPCVDLDCTTDRLDYSCRVPVLPTTWGKIKTKYH